MEEYLHDFLRAGKDLLTHRKQYNCKEKSEMHFIKIKNFSSSEDTIKKMNKRVRVGEKYFLKSHFQQKTVIQNI